MAKFVSGALSRFGQDTGSFGPLPSTLYHHFISFFNQKSAILEIFFRNNTYVVYVMFDKVSRCWGYVSANFLHEIAKRKPTELPLLIEIRKLEADI